jgi:hypothetical protein
MKSIVERLQQATGPDRDLDADIEIALFRTSWVKAPKAPGEIAETPQHFWPEGKLRFFTRSGTIAPAYTASFDAAMSLIGRVYPGASWTIKADACWLRIPHGDDVVEVEGVSLRRKGGCNPIAICLAVMRARLMYPQVDENNAAAL